MTANVVRVADLRPPVTARTHAFTLQVTSRCEIRRDRRPRHIGVTTLLGTAVAVPAMILAVPAFPHREPADSRVVHAQILAVNDFHGHLEPDGLSISAATGTPHGRGHRPAGGAAYLAAHLARAKTQNPDSVVVSAGDLVGGSPMISGRYHDEPTIETMNYILDVGVVGNHEFDEGTMELRRLMGRAEFGVLAANVIDRTTGAPVFPPTALRRVGAATIGFIGTTTTDTRRLAPVQGLTGVRFEDEVATIRRSAPELRRQGADAVVVLTHSGSSRPVDGINGCQGVTRAATRLTEAVAGQVDAVISAHTHNAYVCTVKGTVLTGGSSYGRLFTTVKLTIDPGRHRVTSSGATNRIVTHDVKPERTVAAIVKKWHDRVAPEANRKVGTLRATADRTPTEAGESPLGDLVADSQLAATRSDGARIALVNRGFIRADLERGPVTAGEVFTALPFEHRLVTMTLTGSQLEQVREEQLCSGDPEEDQPRDPLEVSRGFSYRFSATARCGAQIGLKDVKLNGRSLTRNGKYRVSANDFFAPGLNGLPTLGKGTDRVTGPAETDALDRYLKKHDRAPRTGGRITTR
jgi:5'-nucleotidase